MRLWCYIGPWFVGALAYADDIVLLAPSATAMRKMLNITAERKYTLPFFTVGGHTIDNVDQFPHLGHVINSSLNDDADILFRRGHFIGQVNNLLCCFKQLDSLVKNKLFKSFCGNVYGCQLWDLYNASINDFCITWRQSVRRVWGLPRDSSSDLLYLISNSLPIFDQLCRHVVNFVQKWE
jgi:hypothetical protein